MSVKRKCHGADPGFAKLHGAESANKLLESELVKIMAENRGGASFARGRLSCVPRTRCCCGDVCVKAALRARDRNERTDT